MTSDSLWTSETDTGLERQAEQKVMEEHESEIAQESHFEEQEDAAPSIALAVSADDFSALEERVLRAVAMLKHERHARAAAEVRIAEAEELAAHAQEKLSQIQAQIHEQTPQIEQLQSEISQLRSERDAVRHRVERLLEQLDSLEI